CATFHRGASHSALASQCGAGLYRHCRLGNRAIHNERAGCNRGITAVAVVASQLQRTRTLAGQAACTTHAGRDADVEAVVVDGAAARVELHVTCFEKADEIGHMARSAQGTTIKNDGARTIAFGKLSGLHHTTTEDEMAGGTQ